VVAAMAVETLPVDRQLMILSESNPYATVLSIAGPPKKNTLKIKLLLCSVCSWTWY